MKRISRWRKCHREIFQDGGNVTEKYVNKYFNVKEMSQRNIPRWKKVVFRNISINILRWRKCNREIFQDGGNVTEKYVNRYFNIKELSERNVSKWRKYVSKRNISKWRKFHREIV